MRFGQRCRSGFARCAKARQVLARKNLGNLRFAATFRGFIRTMRCVLRGGQLAAVATIATAPTAPSAKSAATAVASSKIAALSLSMMAAILKSRAIVPPGGLSVSAIECRGCGRGNILARQFADQRRDGWCRFHIGRL